MDARSIVRSSVLVAVIALCTAASARAQAVEATSLDSILAQQKAAASTRPIRLMLTSSFVALQGLDTFTTLKGVRGGNAVEANPLVGGLVQHPAAFVAVKSALTAVTVVSMNSVSRKHPKAAMLAMLALNAGSAFVVKSNFQLTMSR